MNYDTRILKTTIYFLLTHIIVLNLILCYNNTIVLSSKMYNILN